MDMKKNTTTMLMMVLGMWLYHVADNALFGPRTVVRVQAQSGASNTDMRSAEALEHIAYILDKIERKIK